MAQGSNGDIELSSINVSVVPWFRALLSRLVNSYRVSGLILEGYITDDVGQSFGRWNLMRENSQLRLLHFNDPSHSALLVCFGEFICSLEDMKIHMETEETWQFRATIYSMMKRFQSLKKLSLYLHNAPQATSKQQLNMYTLVDSMVSSAPRLSNVVVDGQLDDFFFKEVEEYSKIGECYHHPMLTCASRLRVRGRSIWFHLAKAGCVSAFETLASGLVEEDPWFSRVVDEVAEGLLAMDRNVSDGSVVRILRALDQVDFDFGVLIKGTPFAVQILADRASKFVFDAIVEIGSACDFWRPRRSVMDVLCTKTQLSKNQWDMLYAFTESAQFQHPSDVAIPHQFLGDLNGSDNNGDTMLHRTRSPQFAQFLISKNPGLVFAANRRGETPALCAATPDILRVIASTLVYLNQLDSMDLLTDLARYFASQRLFGHVHVIACLSGGLPTVICQSILLHAFEKRVLYLTSSFVRHDKAWRGSSNAFQSARAASLLSIIFLKLTKESKMDMVRSLALWHVPRC
jgi:hypothetical protein